jgi:hypothetical protein
VAPAMSCKAAVETVRRLMRFARSRSGTNIDVCDASDQVRKKGFS